MMNNLLIKGRKALAITAGILFSGLLVNSLNDLLPVNLVQKDYAGYINNEISYNLDNTEEVVIEVNETEKSPEPKVTIDERVIKVRNYLNKRNSPMAQYAEEFVKAADEYGIDYRLVASISVMESSAGLHCFKPYNAWGWGNMTFDSWTDGIWTVSKGLGKYYSNGLNTPQLIAPRYCPPNAVKWASNVSYVMNQISG